MCAVRLDDPPITQWLLEGAPGVDQPQDVLQRLCDGLVEAQSPIDRSAVFVLTPHPNIMGRRFLWNRGATVDVGEAPHSVLEQDVFRLSPIVWLMQHNASMRRRLQVDDLHDYEVLIELREEGFTDYLAQPLAFVNGDVNAVSWATKKPGGFSLEDLMILDRVRAPLSRVAEIYAVRRTATVVLETYVGGRTGTRILAGQIKRGDRQDIEAVILLSDMIGFTRLTDSEGNDKVLDLLNRYYDCLV
ncbi:MAG: adenylate/guanylate cyclase domain-containing protein, partial [Pseudomonadota bacterium]